MSRKSSQPALYEKMRTPRPPAVSEPVSVPVVDEPPPLRIAPAPSEVNIKWLTPGRMIHLPVGYVMLGAAVVLVLVIGAYMLGHRQGGAAVRQQYEQSWHAKAPASEMLQTLDPLVEPVNTTGRGTLASKGSPPGTSLDGASSTWGPVTPSQDPRKRGISYYVLAQTNEDGSRRLAEFCRTLGLESYVVPSKNDRLRKVIALPGFDLSITSRTSPEVVQVRDRILQIGARWKRDNRGES